MISMKRWVDSRRKTETRIVRITARCVLRLLKTHISSAPCECVNSAEAAGTASDACESLWSAQLCVSISSSSSKKNKVGLSHVYLCRGLPQAALNAHTKGVGWNRVADHAKVKGHFNTLTFVAYIIKKPHEAKPRCR